jgi:hypothetical protein
MRPGIRAGCPRVRMPLSICLRLGAWCLAAVIGVIAQAEAFAQPAEPPEERRPDPLPPTAAAPPGYFLLPIPGGQAVFEQLGLRPEERGHALMLIARALHGAAVSNPTGSLAVAFTEAFGPITVAPSRDTRSAVDDGSAVILAPFDERRWRQVLGIDARTDLFTALVKQRGALLVAAGALEVGDGVREWIAENPRFLEMLVREWAGSFVQAAPALTLTKDGWAVPGGDPVPWAALVGAAPSRPDEFLRRLLERDGGRLARFYANVAVLPADTRAALLQPVRGEDANSALASLYALSRDAEAPWSPNYHPYQSSYADLPIILHALADLPIDRLPSTAPLWPALLGTEIDTRERAMQLLQADRAGAPLAATVRGLLREGPRERRDRLTVLAIARRVWDGDLPPRDQADVLYALGHYRRFRALLITLDRLDVKAASVWGRLVDAARRVDGGSGTERALRVQLFQGALALVERAALSGALGSERRVEVLGSLAEAIDSGAATPAAVRMWLLDHFIPALPPLTQPDRFTGTTAYESRILQALAGPPAEAPPQITWEGLDYVADVAAAEHERILRIRAQIASPGLDAALAQNEPAALAAAIRALIYSASLGDPDGAVTLSPDVAERHQTLGTRSVGREFAWVAAAERTGSGQPWHVAGSLMGLDLALARAALRRMSADEMPPVPTINMNDELTLARTAVALRPQLLDNGTQAAIASAIARGRSRVAAAGADPGAVLALADEVAVPTAVRHAVGWTLASIPDAAKSLFSLRDLLWLGHPSIDSEVLAHWGVLSDPVDGRAATRFDAPVPWDRLAGRPDTGILATQVPDVTLRLAEVTSALHLPASLIPALLLYATQDYWHEVEARFPDDWPALVRGASSLPASRVEDFVAALGSGGPLRPR